MVAGMLSDGHHPGDRTIAGGGKEAMSVTPLPYASPSPHQRDFDHIKLLVIFSYIWGAFIVPSLVPRYFLHLSGKRIHQLAGRHVSHHRACRRRAAAILWLDVCRDGCRHHGLRQWTIAGLNLYSARSMQLRKRRIFSVVVAGINCMSFPLGTAAGRVHVYRFASGNRLPHAYLRWVRLQRDRPGRTRRVDHRGINSIFHRFISAL